MPAPGLQPTADGQLDVDVRLDADAHTVTDLWQQLFAEPAVGDAYVRACRALARDRTIDDVYADLDTRGVPYWLHSWIVAVAKGHRADAWELVAERVPAVGKDVGTTDDLLATAGVFDALDPDNAPLTVTVTMSEAFRERRRDQREDTLALLARLATVADVRLVTTGLTRRWLAEHHRADLPGVSDWCNDHRGERPAARRVADARAAFDPDGTHVQVCRLLADEPAGTLSYDELAADASLPGRSRIRQVLGDLGEYGLVETFGSRSDRKVDLRAAGREFVAAIDEYAGRQATLECVSESGKSHSQAVLSREHGEGEEGRRPYRTRWLDRPGHAAAAGAAEDGAVTLAADGLLSGDRGAETDHVRYVSYDSGRDEAVIAVRASAALQHVVSSAIALASPRFFDAALPVGRLADVLDEEAPAILRDARCIGCLSSDALEDATELRDALVAWGEDLADMTTRLNRGEYDDRDRFRSDIMRSAHGLAGSIVHLLDVAGVDVVRELRIPQGLGYRQLQGIAQSVGVMAAVQSRYGAFASYRQLFESREDKRETALSPDVDAADPLGSLIGSLVVRGPDVDRARPALESALGDPADVVDDAPEFAVAVPVRDADRTTTASVAARMLGHKNLSPTRAAVSLLDALAESPYAVADALHQLGESRHRRDVQASDLRYALAHLSAKRLLPECPPTVGAVVAALLRTDADTRLSQADLADRADVTARSVRSHRETLTALGLVEIDERGWRLALGQSDDDGTESTDSEGFPVSLTQDKRLSEVVSDLAAVLLPPSEYADPEGPVSTALSWPADPWDLADHDRLGPWLSLAARLTDADRPTRDRTVAMGPEPAQQPLGGAANGPNQQEAL